MYDFIMILNGVVLAMLRIEIINVRNIKNVFTKRRFKMYFEKGSESSF